MNFELTKKQKDLQQRAKRFTEEEIRPYEKEWLKEMKDIEDWDPKVTAHLLTKARKAGIAQVSVPKEYGGQGLGELERTIVMEEYSKADLLRLPRVVATDPFPIFYEGTEQQKQKYLWPILRGEKFFAWAFTEPGGGSDVQEFKTTAVKKGKSYVLNGHKIFPTAAHTADFCLVCANTDKGKGYRGMSMFLVDKGTPGWKIEKLMQMFNRRDFEPLVKLENCVVPEENLIGKNKGWKVAMTTFNHSRLKEATWALAKAERSLELAIDYAKKRRTFGKPLATRQAIQWILAESKVDVESMRWLVYQTAWAMDQGRDVRLDVAICKLHCIDTALRVIDRCMQVFGGIGLAVDEYPLADFYTFIRLKKSAEGTTEILHYIIARVLLGRELTEMRP